MELLAGLSATTKDVEGAAESIGEEIEVRQQLQLWPRIPILYVEMDGTGIPVVKKIKGRAGK
jgi:hypothetical protein